MSGRDRTVASGYRTTTLALTSTPTSIRDLLKATSKTLPEGSEILQIVISTGAEAITFQDIYWRTTVTLAASSSKTWPVNNVILDTLKLATATTSNVTLEVFCETKHGMG
jgi:hypothetical protein